MALRMVRKPKKKKKKMLCDNVQTVFTSPSKIDETQVQIIKKLQEEAAKEGRYINCVFF